MAVFCISLDSPVLQTLPIFRQGLLAALVAHEEVPPMGWLRFHDEIFPGEIEIHAELAELSLHRAAASGNLAQVQRLLAQMGLRFLEAENIDRKTPLMLALENGHLELAKFLAGKVQVHFLKLMRRTVLIASEKSAWTVLDILLDRGLPLFSLGKDAKPYVEYLLSHSMESEYQRLLQKVGMPSLIFGSGDYAGPASPELS